MKRRMSKPRSARFWVSGPAAMRPCGPPFQEHSPMIMRLLRYTPEQTTTARHAMRAPVVVTTPLTRPPSVSISRASACLKCRCSQLSTALRMRSWYAFLSAWARSECTAGPLAVLSMRDCMNTSSAASPISPPSASSSLTRWPLAVPPMEGLQGIMASESRFRVRSRVSKPMRAHASAASQPAWPAPMTTTSNLSINILSDVTALRIRAAH